MVEYLEILEKKYPVRIGYYVVKVIQEKYELGFEEALKKAENDITMYEDFLYAALEMGAWATKTELDLERDDMQWVLDLCLWDFMKLFDSETFFPKKEQKELRKKIEASQKRTKTSKKTKTQRNSKK